MTSSRTNGNTVPRLHYLAYTQRRRRPLWSCLKGSENKGGTNVEGVLVCQLERATREALVDLSGGCSTMMRRMVQLNMLLGHAWGIPCKL